MGREVDGHADVADARRERARAAARRSRRRVESQPRVEQPAELEDGRVEPLDVADLDGHARRAAPRRRSRSRPRPWSRPAASRRGPRSRARWRRAPAATWVVVGAAMTTASRSASASIASGSAKPWRAGRGRWPRRGRPRSGSATATRRAPSVAPRTRRWLRPIEPSPTSPTRSVAVADRATRSRPSSRRRRPGGRVASRRSTTGRGPRPIDLVLLGVGQAGEHRQRQGPRGGPVGDRQVGVEAALEDVRLAMDRDRVVDVRRRRPRAREVRRRSRRARSPTSIVYWWKTWVRPSGVDRGPIGRSANAAS